MPDISTPFGNAYRTEDIVSFCRTSGNRRNAFFWLKKLTSSVSRQEGQHVHFLERSGWHVLTRDHAVLPVSLPPSRISTTMVFQRDKLTTSNSNPYNS